MMASSTTTPIEMAKPPSGIVMQAITPSAVEATTI
jgi:hypothetical protein